MRILLLVLAMIAAVVRCPGPSSRQAAAQDSGATPGAESPVGQWRTTGQMNERREYAGGVRLKDGRILAVSGHPIGGKSIATAELYDPASGKWTDTGSLQHARNSGNRAVLLHDGRVLLSGGHDNHEVVAGAELFDPAAGKWNDAGTLRVPRDPIATVLADGRVLMVGGIDWYIGDGKTYAACELFDPATGQWTVTGSTSAPRNEQRQVLLDDGRVLVIGGYDERGEPVATAELYDPTSGRWHTVARMPEPRAWFSHVKLQDGRVLVAGGYTGLARKRTYLSSAVIYEPKLDRWQRISAMKDKRGGCAMALLRDGRVLVAGGVAESGWEKKTAELYDPATGSWQTAAPMNVARRNHRMALLPDGSVLVIGGGNFIGNKYLSSCEIFSY